MSFKFNLVDGKHIRTVLYVWQQEGEKRKMLMRKILKDLTKLQRAQGRALLHSRLNKKLKI